MFYGPTPPLLLLTFTGLSPLSARNRKQDSVVAAFGTHKTIPANVIWIRFGRFLLNPCIILDFWSSHCSCGFSIQSAQISTAKDLQAINSISGSYTANRAPCDSTYDFTTPAKSQVGATIASVLCC